MKTKKHLEFITPQELLEAAIESKIEPITAKLIRELLKKLPSVIDIQLLKKSAKQKVELSAVPYNGKADELRIHMGAVGEKIERLLQAYGWQVFRCNVKVMASATGDVGSKLSLSLAIAPDNKIIC